MQLKPGREHYGKLILISVATLMWLLIIILFKAYGYEKTWHLWNVPTQKFSFQDFRLIPGSAESFRHGFEPSIENPYDPTQRIFNYPAFWRLFFYTGISEADTVWISVSMIILFFIAVFLLPKELSIAGAMGILLVIFSPASMLLYERGNVDLIVFFICAMIVIAESYSANVAAFLIAAGAIVKLFPIVGVSVLLKESKNKFWLLSGICTSILVAYMVLTWSSVTASWNFTMRDGGLSYGTNVFVTRYHDALYKVFSRWLPPYHVYLLLNYAPIIIGLMLLGLVAILAFRNTQPLEILNERNIAAFRMGASVYAGTFLLGNNYDYRLAFLIFVIPQLIEWIHSGNNFYRNVAWLSVSLVLLSCWHLWIVEIPLESVLHSVENSKKFWIVLDETFNWSLFISLAYLLFASAPDWLKNPLRNFLPVRI